MITLPADEAETLCGIRNRLAGYDRTRDCNPWVIVVGPEDGEATVMRMTEAIDGDFDYRWVTR